VQAAVLLSAHRHPVTRDTGSDHEWGGAGKDLKIIDLVYINAGGGHQSAAKALEAVIREQARPWCVRLVNLFEVLDPGSVFRRTTGLNPEDVYNKRLARGWTLGLAQELVLLQLLIRASHNTITNRLRQHWRETKPDLVVSLVPNFNRSMYESLQLALPPIPYVTLLTDFADYPSHFWIEPNQKQHFICGTAKAAHQARMTASRQATIHQTSGMILGPQFYSGTKIDRATEMRKCGLDPDRPTGLVLFGGQGSRVMCGIAENLADVQLILMCGHNAQLASRLRAMEAAAPRLIVNFTRNVPYFMTLSDFFVGKPGPGSISEAVQKRLPVIVARNAYTMPQERYNTVWVLEHGVGVVLKSFKAVRQGVTEVTERLNELRENTKRIRNRALFEVPEILDRILQGKTSLHRGARQHDPCSGRRMALSCVRTGVLTAPSWTAVRVADRPQGRLPAPVLRPARDSDSVHL
jgi:UDP-N-acetylglucosamine:LPS N-acetylglucosamine transferase